MANKKASISDRPWLKVSEVQDYMPIGMNNIRKLIKDGSIKSVKPKHGPVLTKKEWVDVYLESCENGTPGNEIERLLKEVTHGR